MPTTLTSDLQELPQWSDWARTDLGFADVPNAIQCRGPCKRIYPAAPLYFQRKRIGLRYQTTCRMCMAKNPYRRTLKGQESLIMNDPTLPNMFKAREMAVAVARKTANLRAAREREATAHFKSEWTLLRKMIVQRKELLVNNITQSRFRCAHGAQSGLWYGMENSAAVARYVRTLLATYGCIVERLMHLSKWLDTLGGVHYPPPAWKLALEAGHEAEEAHKYKFKGSYFAYPTRALLAINPWVLTTRDERSRVDALVDEVAHDGYWLAIVDARPNGTLKQHLYPWQYPHKRSLVEDTPDWLRAFNGVDKETAS